MHLTTAQITKFFTTNSRTPQQTRRDEEISEIQRVNARKAMNHLVIASDARVIRQHISNLSTGHLAMALNDCSASPAIKGLLDAIIYATPHHHKLPGNYNNDYIKVSLTNLRRNKFGYTATLLQVENALLLKDLTGDPELRALIISNFALNHLRHKCPNFRYFYGFLNVDEIVGDETRIESWLPNPNVGKYSLMLWENVEMNPHAMVVSSALRTMSREQFLNMYLQILYALRLADDKYEFTHYNLTPDNVYLVTTKETAIPYNGEYLETTKFAKMIDYRHAHAAVHVAGGEYHFGTTGLSTFQTQSFPLQDAYMFLMTCMVLARGYDNGEVVETGRILHQFFNVEDTLENALYDQEQFKYHLPYTKETKVWPLADYIAYVRESFQCPFMKDITTLPVYGQPHVGSMVRLGLTSAPNPIELLDFYDLYLFSENPPRVKEHFDYFTGIRTHVSIIRKLSDRVRDIFLTLDIIPVNQGRFMRDVYALFNAYDYFMTVEYYSKCAIAVADIFEDIATREKVRSEFLALQENIMPVVDQWNVELYKRMGNSYLYQFWSRLVSR